MKEAYCSFEVSKLLKAKGFDEPCKSYYVDNEDYISVSYSDEDLTDLQTGVWETLRPTHQMACAWLREKHNIFVIIGYNRYYKEYKYGVFSMNIDIENEHSASNFKSYEEAVDAALKYVLEHLIINNESIWM